MGTLDYIQADTLEYKYYENYMTRYGFDWRLVFFETFFRDDQIGERPEDTRPYVYFPASILRKSTSGRHRPVSYPDGPMTARYRFT